MAFGLQPAAKPKACFDVWPENWQAIEVFCECTDDWNSDQKGRYRSINKLALESIMRMLEIKNMKEMFKNIMIMQAAALEVLNHG